MSHRAVRNFIISFVAAIVVAAAVVVIVSQVSAAKNATARAEAAEAALTETRTELTATQASLSFVETRLAEASVELDGTREELVTRSARHDTLQERVVACRHLVRAYDYMLLGDTAQSEAIGFMTKGKNAQASESLYTAARWFRAIEQIAVRNGYSDTGRMAQTCAPPLKSETADTAAARTAQ